MIRLILIIFLSLTLSGCALVPVVIPMKESCTQMNFRVIEGMTVERYFNRTYTPAHRSRYCSKKVPEKFTYKFSNEVVLNMSVLEGRVGVSSESEKIVASIRSKNASVLKSSEAGQVPAWKTISTNGIKDGYMNLTVNEQYEVNLYFEPVDCSCPISVW